MAEIESGYYYIKDGLVLKEDGYTDSVDKVGKVVGFDYETKIRNKAIEEFAERLKDFIAKNVEDADSSNDLCCEIFQSEIDEIAESMKGEKE